MAADIYGNNAILAELLVGRRPEWFKQATYTAVVPITVTSGVSLLGPGGEGYSPKAGVRVDLRRNIHRHEARVSIFTQDLTAGVYRVVLGGVNADYNAGTGSPANTAALLEGIRAACDAVSGFDAVVINAATGAAAVSPAVNDAVLVYRTDGTVFTTDFSVTGGSGALEVEADAISGVLTTYALDTGTGTDAVLTRWSKLPGYSGVSVDTSNYRDEWDTPGLARIYIAVVVAGVVGNGANVTNFTEVRVGPARLESDPP
jgi:hypothetical protein